MDNLRVACERRQSGHSTEIPAVYFEGPTGVVTPISICNFGIIPITEACTMNIKEIASNTLQDALFYLNGVEPQIYSMPLELLFGASIGQHTRHFVEFYQCLLDQTMGEGRVVNYALRARDLRIEEEPVFAADRIGQISSRLLQLDENFDCELVCDEHVDEASGMTVPSNLERELIYNIEHTIHHLAIIKIGLNAVAPQITLPAHFGVAPSTIRHKQKICAQ